MAFEQIEAPKDVLTSNQWTLEIEGTRYATIHKLDGLGMGAGTVERADGGTGIKYKFHDNTLNVDQLTFTRVVDPADALDNEIDTFFKNSIQLHTKYNASLVKFHKGSELFRIRFYGLLFVKETHPSLDKITGALYEVTYQVECDFYEKVLASS